MLLYDQIFSRYQKRHAEENWKISYHIADKTIGAVLPNDKRLIFFIQTKDNFLVVLCRTDVIHLSVSSNILEIGPNHLVLAMLPMALPPFFCISG